MLINEAIMRYEMRQTVNQFLVNMLKDAIRRDYENYDGSEDFCQTLLKATVAALISEASTDPRCWRTLDTQLGQAKFLSQFGHYLDELINRYNCMKDFDLRYITSLARQKVGS